MKEDNSKEYLRAWVTKYAFSDGVIAVDGHIPHYINKKVFCYAAMGSIDINVHGNDWHRTKEAALEHVENQRKKKIASLKKQIEKLENMAIIIPD